MRIASLLIFGLALLIPEAAAAATPSDALVKASGPAVYYHASDGRRYVFPNQRTYQSWFSDFNGVTQITDAELAAIPLGGNVTYRPGVRMVKIQSDPKVYAVGAGGGLRWVTTETLAEDLYGQYWNAAIDDVSDAFFVNYRVGDPIDSVDDFSPTQTALIAATINADKDIAAGPAPRLADTAVANPVEAWRTYAFNHINELRTQDGKPPLVMNPLLNRIATIHSKDMAFNIKAMSHDGSLGETAHERIKQGKVPDVVDKVFASVPFPENIGWSGENVGMRNVKNFGNSAEKAIKSQHDWFMDEPVDQPNHRTTMLSTLYPFSEIGIGLYLDDKGNLWITEDYISTLDQ